MQKVLTINPLDGEDRADLNKLLENGWISMFYMPIKDGDHVFLYYHLQKVAGTPTHTQQDYEDELDDIDETDTDLEDRWGTD